MAACAWMHGVPLDSGAQQGRQYDVGRYYCTLANLERMLLDVHVATANWSQPREAHW